MKAVDLLLTAATFIAFVLAVYLFSSDPVLSGSVNWAEDRAPEGKASAKPADIKQNTGAVSSLPVPISAPAQGLAINYPPATQWKYIVIHNSGTRQGNAKMFDTYHRNEKGMKDGLAYHFVIGNGKKSKDGGIEVGKRWDRQIAGAHCYDSRMNCESVGICLVGDFNESKPTARQMESLLKLIADLQTQYRIPKANILLHKEVDKRQTDCPGRKFPANKIR
ncbi:MAG: N-acetylmuramoyl-L-alanine amidase [Planctomycetes bacterium]|nr:N-acetylmuramoyl-L-alanine amidase [Planctomycetota bacterium]